MNFISNWSLNKKFSANIALLAIGAAWLAGLGIKNLNKAHTSMTYVSTTVGDRIATINALNAWVRQLALDESDMILSETKEDLVKNQKEIVDDREQITKLIETHKKISSSETLPQVEAYAAIYQQWAVINDRMVKLVLEGSRQEAAHLASSKCDEFRETMISKLDALLKINMDKRAAAINEEAESYTATRNTTIVISVLSILLSCLVAAWVLRALSRDINKVISDLEDNTSRLRGTAHKIADSSAELSQATTEQAASLEETAASIEEMSAMVQKNSENAKNSSHSSGKSEEKANHGQSVVREMMSSISDIEASNKAIMTQVTESNQQISEITKVIADIGNKTKVINDIVFQTKLLSFNASVEAARAGEHGKGFAVVAEEIGNLAQMSGNAAKEISTMLETSISSVETIVKQTREKVEHLIQSGSEKVQAGTRVARQCGEVLSEIVTNVSQVATMVNEISAASQEQAQGVSEINKAIAQLGQVTQENAVNSDESAKSAEELSGQADMLRNVLNSLVHTIQGGNASTENVAPPSNNQHGKRRPTSTTKASAPRKNVLSFRGKTTATKHESSHEPTTVTKKAVGDDAVPSSNDPRFEEI